MLVLMNFGYNENNWGYNNGAFTLLSFEGDILDILSVVKVTIKTIL
jgi:hypothetical protein